jgi:hypothetical protein
MPTKANMATFYVLLGLTLVVWIGMGVRLSNKPSGSHDDIGDSILTALVMLLLWGLLIALLWMGGAGGAMPMWAKVLAWILHPATLVASIAVLDRANNPAGSWLIVVPIVSPVMMAGYATWLYFPAIGAAISAPVAGSAAWGVLFILAILPWAYMMEEDREHEEGQAAATAANLAYQGRAAHAESLVSLQKLTPDTPLWRWMDFADPRLGVRDEAFAGIRKLSHRQTDANEMLQEGVTHFLVELPNLDLEPTPTIIAAHKKYVLGLARGIERPDAGSVKYSWVAHQIDEYLPSIQWMAERHCGCSAEVAVLEAGVRKYKRSVGKAECLEALAKAQATDKN